MNIELINKILIETADLVGQVNDTEAMRGKLLKKLTTVTVMLNEKAPPGGSLLAHLTSLTVAERETILRVSEMMIATGYEVTFFDGDAKSEELDASDAVELTLKRAEQMLRRSIEG